jgi:flagellar FliJ protein
MSAGQSRALDLAIAQAADKHQAAEKALGQARNRLRSAEATYGTLNGFCGEYAGRLRGINRFSKDSLANYHRFLGKLGHALASQKIDVDAAGHAVSQQQAAWQDALRRLKAMELLRDQRAAAALARQQRQDQKLTDEFAARSTRRITRHV